METVLGAIYRYYCWARLVEIRKHRLATAA
jgi:hypothetical protein